MSAWQPGMQICVKVVNVFDRNLERGLPNHLAIVNLFDPETGAVTCVMDGTYITGIRTPPRPCCRTNCSRGPRAGSRRSSVLAFKRESICASCLSCGISTRFDLLARVRACRAPGSSASEGARPSGCEVRDQTLGRSVSATHSAAPVIESDWVQAGTHVSSIGYHPPDGELPRALACDHRLFVETTDAFATPPVGCPELSGVDSAQGTTLGEVINDRRKGRASESEVTVYKAMGIAMEDMVAANLAYRAARRSRGGVPITW